MGVISFDGRWLAFARNVAPADPGAAINGQWKGFENEDYHKFHAWDIHVVSIDGELSTQSIRVGHGYWPSWGEDSGVVEKTLYFSNYEEGAVYAAKINDAVNKVGVPYLHAKVAAWTAGGPVITSIVGTGAPKTLSSLDITFTSYRGAVYVLKSSSNLVDWWIVQEVDGQEQSTTVTIDNPVLVKQGGVFYTVSLKKNAE